MNIEHLSIMKYAATIFLLVVSTLLVNAQGGTSQIASAEVSFTFVNNDVDGTIEGFKSNSTIDVTDFEKSSFSGSVEVTTIDTGNSIRNWSLRRSKYFDADTHPKITFESTSISQDGQMFKVNGDLTIKGVTKNISFQFEGNGKQLTGKTTIYSSDYGISIKDDRNKNKVLVKIVIQLK